MELLPQALPQPAEISPAIKHLSAVCHPSLNHWEVRKGASLAQWLRSSLGVAKGKKCVESLQNVEPRKSGSRVCSRGVFPCWNGMQGRRKLFAGTEGMRGEALRRGRSWVLVNDYGGWVNGASLIAQLHAGRRLAKWEMWGNYPEKLSAVPQSTPVG